MSGRPDARQREVVSNAVVSRWRRVDLVLAMVLLVVLGVVSLAMVQVGVIVAAPADVCGGVGVRCDFAQIDGAALATRLIPVVLLVAALSVAVLRVRRHRTVFFVPLVGLVGVVATFYLGSAVVGAAITG